MTLVGMSGILIQALVGKMIKEIKRDQQNVQVVFTDATTANFEWRDGLLFVGIDLPYLDGGTKFSSL